MFDALKSRGVKWDIIGMSAYPRWSHLDGPTMITQVMANIKDLKKRYVEALLKTHDMQKATAYAFVNKDNLDLFVREWKKFWKGE